MVYLIHFDKPLKHASHYVGFVKRDLKKRVEKHQNGSGAKILRALMLEGIGWKVVRTWKDADRNFERSLKKTNSTKDYCPICQKGHARDYKPKPKKEDDGGSEFPY